MTNGIAQPHEIIGCGIGHAYIAAIGAITIVTIVHLKTVPIVYRGGKSSCGSIGSGGIGYRVIKVKVIIRLLRPV